MKIFVGQRVSGEDLDQLREWSHEICNVLNRNGHETYCNASEKVAEDKTPKEKMEMAFRKIDEFDTFLGIIRSDKKSEGMLIEAGYVIAKDKNLIIAVQEDVQDKFYVHNLANKLIVFKDHNELKEKLNEIK